MIRYTAENDWLLTTQPHHALVSASLAAHWRGDADFPRPAPWPLLLVAVAEHDLGWHAWEAAPTLNRRGEPRDFLEMSLDDHLAIWRQGIAYALQQSRLIALLVSCHFTYLYEGRRSEAPVLAMLDEQSALQARLRAELGLDERATREAYSLIRLMDWFSLALALGRAEHGSVDLGSGPGGVPLVLEPLDDATRLTVRPWPFDTDSLHVRMEARRVPRRTFADDADFRETLRQAPLVLREWRLMRVGRQI